MYFLICKYVKIDTLRSYNPVEIILATLLLNGLTVLFSYQRERDDTIFGRKSESSKRKSVPTWLYHF